MSDSITGKPQDADGPAWMMTGSAVKSLPEMATASPSDNGVLKMIVSRPSPGERVLHREALVLLEGGLEGDRWATASWMRLDNGLPDPRSIFR